MLEWVSILIDEMAFTGVLFPIHDPTPVTWPSLGEKMTTLLPWIVLNALQAGVLLALAATFGADALRRKDRRVGHDGRAYHLHRVSLDSDGWCQDRRPPMYIWKPLWRNP